MRVIPAIGAAAEPEVATRHHTISRYVEAGNWTLRAIVNPPSDRATQNIAPTPKVPMQVATVLIEFAPNRLNSASTPTPPTI
jgi:hypothetical protein